MGSRYPTVGSSIIRRLLFDEIYSHEWTIQVGERTKLEKVGVNGFEPWTFSLYCRTVTLFCRGVIRSPTTEFYR